VHPVIELDLETDTPQRLIFLNDLVTRVSSGDPSGIEDLDHLFSPGIRFFLRRQLGLQNLDDNVAKVFLTLTQSIQHGELTEPVQLVAFVRNVIRREVALLRAQPCVPQAAPPPSGYDLQNVAIAKEILTTSDPRDRDVLRRFHVLKQLPARICADLNLTEPQFCLILARARTAFTEQAQARAKRIGPGQTSRTFSASMVAS
jgi:hypothetical protein